MDILHTPCVPIIIAHTLFSCTHLHVEYNCELILSIHMHYTLTGSLCMGRKTVYGTYVIYHVHNIIISQVM